MYYHLKSYRGMMVLQMIILPEGTMATERMNIEECFKLVRLVRAQYGQANRRGKAELLDHLEMITGLHRKRLP